MIRIYCLAFLTLSAIQAIANGLLMGAMSVCIEHKKRLRGDLGLHSEHGDNIIFYCFYRVLTLHINNIVTNK